MDYQELSLGLSTHDLEGTLKFYVDVLGFKNTISIANTIALEKDNISITFHKVLEDVVISPIGIGIHGYGFQELYDKIQDKVIFKYDFGICVENGFTIFDNNKNEITFYLLEKNEK